jgi:hypothetical protein
MPPRTRHVPASPRERSARRFRQHGLAVALAAVLAGCGTSAVVVESNFPVPLVAPLPVRVGIVIGEDLQNFVHAEAIPQQATWTITLGDANVAMLKPLFGAMFLEARDISNIPAEQANLGTLDGVLRPTLDKFEFDVPVGERDQFVEVWMQYRLFLYEINGDVIAEWPVTGYGKAELSGNREQAVQRAAIVAMREAGATISTQFANQPQVHLWLEERANAAPLSTDGPVNN